MIGNFRVFCVFRGENILQCLELLGVHCSNVWKTSVPSCLKRGPSGCEILVSPLPLNIFVSADQTVVREDDFGGDVGGVRFVDKVLPGDFANKRLRIGSAKFDR